MSASLRRFRAGLYVYSDAGASGVMDSTYTKSASMDTDGDWWCAKAQPSGRESTLVRAPEHRVDAVFSFAAEAPVDQDMLLVVDGVQYLVRAVLSRDYGRDEVQVLAEKCLEDFDLT